MTSKSILIVSFVFPPFPGIGGRRWAKFSKELAARGYRVFILAAKNPFHEISSWINDVQNNPGIKIKYLPLNYPRHLLAAPENVYQKIMYKLSLIFLRLTTRGNYYDRAVKWNRQLVRETEKILEDHPVKNIIVSGAPFHLAHHLIPVKKKFPGTNFIVDFRDPWTNNPKFFGLSSLSEKRQSQERKMEEEVVCNADVIISVAKEMNDFLKQQYSLAKARFVSVENGFDKTDFSHVKPMKKAHEKIKFILAGTLYLNVKELFYALVGSLAEIKMHQPESFHLLQFDFYGDVPAEYKKICLENNLENFKFYGKIPLPEVYNRISESDICMLFLQDHLKFSLSTKFCEYISQKKKIIVFSCPGKTSGFIIENNLGYAASPDNVTEVLLKIIDDYKAGQLEFDSSFNIDQYSIPRLTDKLIDCLK